MDTLFTLPETRDPGTLLVPSFAQKLKAAEEKAAAELAAKLTALRELWDAMKDASLHHSCWDTYERSDDAFEYRRGARVYAALQMQARAIEGGEELFNAYTTGKGQRP